jgi:folate-binding protein YgfZ
MMIETWAYLFRSLPMHARSSFYEFMSSAHLLVTDEDAADFLQSQFTNDLRPFEPGRGAYGLWLNVKGRVIADSVIFCEGEERFRVISEGCPGDQIRAHLERHIIADDVIVETLNPAPVFEFQATQAQALDLTSVDSGAWRRCPHGILFSRRDGILWLVADSSKAADAFRQELSSAGLEPQDEIERGLARVAAGVPSIPDEIGEADLPGEGELLEAISFTKGCYLGQEVVARMHNIGQAQRRLFVVTGEGEAPGLPCSLVNADGKNVGDLRSAFAEGASWTGVALLKTRFVEVGQPIFTESIEVAVLKPLREAIENG